MAEIERKAEKLTFPDKVKELFKREVEKLKRLNQQSPDYNVQLNYLQTLVALPWGINTEDNLSIKMPNMCSNVTTMAWRRLKSAYWNTWPRFATERPRKPPYCAL